MVASIFNEVLGPVMIGQSSSHTAAPGRIGLVGYRLLGGEPSDILIKFDKMGSFAACYNSQGSDFGFVGGLLGIPISDPRLRDSLETAKERGISVRFEKTDLANVVHPNQAEMELTAPDGKKVYMTALSVGGGMFEVISYMGFAVSIAGDCYDTLLLAPAEKAAELAQTATAAGLEVFGVSEKDGRALVQLKSDEPPAESLLAAVKALGAAVVPVTPVLPSIKKRKAQMPFTNAAGAAAYAKENNLQPWEVACAYESAVTGKTQEEILAYMSRLVDIMREAAVNGVAGNFEPRGFLAPQTPAMSKRIEKEGLRGVDMGYLNKAILWACGTLEYDIGRGCCVAGPTGGSCGVLPASLISIGEDLGRSHEEICKSMMVAGLVGAFISNDATFAAEMGGCQAENGSASAMAAGGLAQLFGGTIEECFASSVLAIENILGLVCDPIAGVGNIPCISRNAMATANAALSATMVLNGFDSFVSLDQAIFAMDNVGKLMHGDLRCTGRGGLCITKEGQEAERCWQEGCAKA